MGEKLLTNARSSEHAHLTEVFRLNCVSRRTDRAHFFRNVGDDWSCAPENHLPENNVKLFRRIPEGSLPRIFVFAYLSLARFVWAFLACANRSTAVSAPQPLVLVMVAHCCCSLM